MFGPVGQRSARVLVFFLAAAVAVVATSCSAAPRGTMDLARAKADCAAAGRSLGAPPGDQRAWIQQLMTAPRSGDRRRRCPDAGARRGAARGQHGQDQPGLLWRGAGVRTAWLVAGVSLRPLDHVRRARVIVPGGGSTPGYMRYPDGGGLTAAGRVRRERMRLQAAQMFEQDVRPVQVAHRLRVSAKSAYQWRRRRWRRGRRGRSSPPDRPSTWRPGGRHG